MYFVSDDLIFNFNLFPTAGRTFIVLKAAGMTGTRGKDERQNKETRTQNKISQLRMWW